MNINFLGNSLEILANIIKDSAGIYIEPKKNLAINRAENKIKIENAKNQLELDKIDLINRTKLRIFETELHRQMNLEEIIQETFNILPEKSNPQNIDKNWINYFISKAQDSNDNNLKSIWANILMQESIKSNSFSRFTLDVLSRLTYDDCKLFNEFSKKVIKTENHSILIKIEAETTFQKKYNFSYSKFIKLCDYGLINYSELSHIIIPVGKKLLLTLPDGKMYALYNNDKKKIILELYFLTIAGSELLNVATNEKDTIYFNNLLEYFSENNLTLEDISKYPHNVNDKNTLLHDDID